jgi:hypothetical protein
MNTNFDPKSVSSSTLTRPLKLDEIQPLCDRDIAQMKENLNCTSGNQIIRLAFTPSFKQVSWHLTRAEIMAKAIFSKIPQAKGAITESRQSWIYWDHDLRAQELVIIRLVSLNHMDIEQRKSEVISLLEAAVREAAEWNLPKVFLWSPDEIVSNAVKTIYRRDELSSVFEDGTQHLPSLRWHAEKSIENVNWEYNEYFAWC